MMVVVSQKTCTSNWVPFEVGYGQAMLMDLSTDDLQGSKKLKLSILTLKDLAHETLPDYMHLAYEIRGASTLNGFIAKLLKMPVEKGIRENRMRENYHMGKALNEVLEWSR
ncbi:MAG: hypothetical protein IPL46_01890 [Saprospiraceae bacterium]|nr:hypothetical protein [Saprospiraceae bacterium]